MSAPLAGLGRAYRATRDFVDRLMNDHDFAAKRWFDRFIYVLILASVALLMVDFTVGTLGELPPTYREIDVAILTIFALEYVLRLWVASPELPHRVRLPWRTWLVYQVSARLNWMLKPFSLIDLAAILPLFPFLTSLRILRILRLFTHTATINRLFRFFNPFAAAGQTLRTNRLLFLFVSAFIALTVVLGAATSYIAEHRVNEKFASPFDAVYWASVTLTTVGFGDITPVTPGGKLIAMVIMFTGFFLLALSAGAVSQTFVPALLQIREEGIRMTTLVNHLVLCGWNRHTPMLLRELQAHAPELAHHVVVFADREAPDELPSWAMFVKGDPTQETELSKVRLPVAAGVLVVADETPGASYSDRDARTLLTVFTLRAFELKMEAKGLERADPLHITAELLDPDNMAFFRAAGADEVIETARSGSALLAHAATHPLAGELLASLVAEHGPFLERREVPERFDLPIAFWDLAAALKREDEVLPIGIEREGTVTYNPDADTPVNRGDRLVYIKGSARTARAVEPISFWEPLRRAPTGGRGDEP